jgi:hypothetical protein
MKETENMIEVFFVEDVFFATGEIIGRQGESERFLPLFVQSCMEPGKQTVHPVETEEICENGIKYLVISDYGKKRKYPLDKIKLKISHYEQEKSTRGCIPCKNCGRC